MKNPFRLLRFSRNHKSKSPQAALLPLLQTWSYLESLFKSGMLSFDDNAHRLFITQPLATLLLARGAEGWLNSIHAIYQYIHFRQTQQAWEQFFHEQELEAVRAALTSPAGDKITRDDIERIKRTCRAEIDITDMEPPKVEPFEFLIIPDSTEPKVEPIAIGHYDPETAEMEVATWQEVKQYLMPKGNEK